MDLEYRCARPREFVVVNLRVNFEILTWMLVKMCLYNGDSGGSCWDPRRTRHKRKRSLNGSFDQIFRPPVAPFDLSRFGPSMMIFRGAAIYCAHATYATTATATTAYSVEKDWRRRGPIYE